MGSYEKTTLSKSNEGFSLIELIVSVAILSVVLGPILSSFVISFNQNKKARITENETNIVQEVAEDLKSMSMGDIKKYGDPTTVDGITTYTKTFNKGNKDYKLIITLDKKEALGDVYYDYNNFDLPIISNIDDSKKIIVAEFIETPLASAALYNNYNWEREARKNSEGNYVLDPKTEEDIKNDIQRYIYIDIVKDVTGSDTKIKVRAEYSCKTEPQSIHAGKEEIVLRDTIFEVGIKDVYLFFRPLASDKIIINKGSGIEQKDIYLVCQKDSTLPDYNLNNIEISDNIIGNIYSNLESNNPNLNIKPLVKTEKKHRISNASIKLYEYGVAYDTATPLVEFNTAKEE